MAQARARPERAGPFGIAAASRLQAWAVWDKLPLSLCFRSAVARRVHRRQVSVAALGLLAWQPSRHFANLYRPPPAPVIPIGEVEQAARNLGWPRV